MTLTVWVYGMDPDDLTDREKEELAVAVHDLIAENFHPIESVDVEGYREGP